MVLMVFIPLALVVVAVVVGNYYYCYYHYYMTTTTLRVFGVGRRTVGRNYYSNKNYWYNY